MARIKLGPLVTDIAGSIGGATIQRNRFGYTMRSKPLPLHSETPAQYNIRRKIIALQYAWQDLTDDQRLQWDRFINFSGQSIRRDRSARMSGHGLFLKYQLFRLLYDLPLLTEISYIPMPDFEILYHIYKEPAALHLHFYDDIDFTYYFFVCKLTSPRREAQAFNFKGLRFMKATFYESDQYLITTQYLAAFGALPPTATYLHYSIQYWSILAPVFTGVFTGKIVVTAL